MGLKEVREILLFNIFIDMGNLDIVSRMKLLMEYDSSKTAKENKIICEQPSPNKVPNQTQLNQIAHCKSTPRDYNYFAPSVSANVDKLCDNLKLTFPGYYTNTEAYQYSQSEVNQQNQQNQPKANIAIEMERQNRIVNTPTPPDPPLEYNGDILSKPGTKLPSLKSFFAKCPPIKPPPPSTNIFFIINYFLKSISSQFFPYDTNGSNLFKSTKFGWTYQSSYMLFSFATSPQIIV